MLLDLRMPGQDGLSVLRTMKQKWPESEVVIITGYPTVDSAKQAVQLGAYDYVAKPVGPQDVINVTDGAITRKQWAPAPRAGGIDCRRRQLRGLNDQHMNPNRKPNASKIFKMEKAMNASRKVLVVDDDPVVRKSFDRVLSGKGYAVITAESGEEALRKLNEEKYDLVYTDIRMPGMSGLEVAEEVKARKPWTPVVIITGYGTEAARSPRQGRRRRQLRAQTAVARNDRRQRPRRLGGALRRRSLVLPAAAGSRLRPKQPPAAAPSRTSCCSSPRPSSAWPISLCFRFVGLGVMAVLARRAASQDRRREQGSRLPSMSAMAIAAPMVGLALRPALPVHRPGDIAVAGGPGGCGADQKLIANGQLGLAQCKATAGGRSPGHFSPVQRPIQTAAVGAGCMAKTCTAIDT